MTETDTDERQPSRIKQVDVEDEFVREHAVPADEAESYVHIGLDHHYHPQSGFWFPTGSKWGEASGWCSRRSEIPEGEIIQYPCEDRDPEVRGNGELPDGAVNRTIQEGAA